MTLYRAISPDYLAAQQMDQKPEAKRSWVTMFEIGAAASVITAVPAVGILILQLYYSGTVVWVEPNSNYFDMGPWCEANYMHNCDKDNFAWFCPKDDGTSKPWVFSKTITHTGKDIKFRYSEGTVCEVVGNEARKIVDKYGKEIRVVGKGQPGFMREPSNAFSALAFLWVSIYIAILAVKDSQDECRPEFSIPPAVSWIFAVTNLVHFLGCFLNHSSRMHACHCGDAFGMQLIVWTILLWSVVRRYSFGSDDRIAFSIMLTLILTVSPTILGASLSRYADPLCEEKETGLMGGLFLAIVVVNFGELHRHVRSIVALGLGVVFQIGDKAHYKLWNPDWPVHGHAIWHVATAIAMLLFYVNLREPPSFQSDYTSCEKGEEDDDCSRDL